MSPDTANLISALLFGVPTVLGFILFKVLGHD